MLARLPSMQGNFSERQKATCQGQDEKHMQWCVFLFCFLPFCAQQSVSVTSWTRTTCLEKSIKYVSASTFLSINFNIAFMDLVSPQLLLRSRVPTTQLFTQRRLRIFNFFLIWILIPLLHCLYTYQYTIFWTIIESIQIYIYIYIYMLCNIDIFIHWHALCSIFNQLWIQTKNVLRSSVHCTTPHDSISVNCFK